MQLHEPFFDGAYFDSIYEAYGTDTGTDTGGLASALVIASRLRSPDFIHSAAAVVL